MRDLHICHIISGLDDGGAEAVLYRLCRHATRFRHTVISLTNEGKYGSLFRSIGIDVLCLDMPRGLISIKGLLNLWRVLGQIQPDVVQTWMYHADLLGGFFAYLRGIRSICWGVHHTNLEPGKSKVSTIIVAKFCAGLSKLIPRRIICCANKAAEAHSALGYESEKLVVIPNGYELAVFKPNPLAGSHFREEMGLDANVPLIGMVGRFHPMKDHHGLIIALELLASRGIDFRFVLVGTGMDEDNSSVKGWIESAGLVGRIHLVGRRDDIPAVMSALDVHVLSSFGEAFPNVLAEAMACGTPCVTTDVGDAAMIVGNTGWVIPPGDPDALASAMSEALQARDHSSDWYQRCVAVRSRIEEHFSIETMCDSYARVWEKVCQS